MTVQSSSKHVNATFLASGVIQLNNSDATVAANNIGETVLSMRINRATWSCANGVVFTVSRGANVVAQYAGNGDHKYSDTGVVIDNIGGNPQANVVITKTGAGQSFLALQLHKTSVIRK